MKLTKSILVLPLLAFLSNCHPTSVNVIQKLPVKLEFQKMAWLEGLWSNTDDSIHVFTLWQKTNDSILYGLSWRINGKDSIPIQTNEIHSVNEDIYLSIEIFGKNDGMPDEYTLMSNKNGEHVFERENKDFPQRIIYLLKPDGSLYMRMEGTTEGQACYKETNLTKIR